jgi:siroheme synthase-like protein
VSRTLFPVFLDLDDRLVVVVGGGAVATERAAKLAAHGARVRVVSPEVSPALSALIAEGTVVEHRPRA